MIDLLYYAAAGIGVAFFIVVFLWLVGHKDWSIWHGVAFGVIACLVTVAIDHYVNLFDWIYLGIMFVDIGASLFVIGMVAMICVMAYNLIETGGRTAIR